MASFFTLTLDTTAPASPTLALESNNQYATALLVTATIGTGDGATAGYQMKLWGDIDLAWAKTNGVVGGAATTVLEADALWITYATSKQLQLSATDGTKTVYLKIRDDVYNVSAQASDAIILDTTRPIVNITGPDVAKVSKQAGKDISSFTFTVDTIFVEYKVKVVSSSGSAENTGTTIAATNGSTNMSGVNAGGYAASTAISCTIDGADLEIASSGDAAKIIKVFAKDQAGNWSA
jgi:hypothetical protein